jgi:uncharacterized protein YkwD
MQRLVFRVLRSPVVVIVRDLAPLALVILLLAAVPALSKPAGADFSDPATQQRAQELMTQLVNQVRAQAGAGSVHFDPVAAQAARLHAQDMLQRGYFSHWDPNGNKPTRRYNQLGGYHSLGENIYFFHGQFGSMEAMVQEALDKLLSSEGHRRTILNPAYTGIGISFAADPRKGDLYVAQEFVAKLGGEYRCPLNACVGQMIEYAGRFDPQRYAFENIIVGYEDRPQQRDLLWLSRTDTYRDGDRLVAGYTANPQLEFRDLQTYRDVQVDAEQGWFKSGIRLAYKGREGMYYLFLWLRDLRTGQPVLASTVSVDVTEP